MHVRTRSSLGVFKNQRPLISFCPLPARNEPSHKISDLLEMPTYVDMIFPSPRLGEVLRALPGGGYRRPRRIHGRGGIGSGSRLGRLIRVIVCCGYRQSGEPQVGLRGLSAGHLGQVPPAPQRQLLARTVRAVRLLQRAPGDHLLLPGQEALLQV